MPKTSNFVRWIPALTWMLLIFLLSNQPGGDSGKLSKLILDWLGGIGIDFRAWFGDDATIVIRKLAHFVEYGILYLLCLWPLGRRKPWLKGALLALLLTFLYACSDELHQSFIPRRVGQFSDVMIDTLGATFAFLSIWLLRSLIRKRPRKAS